MKKTFVALIPGYGIPKDILKDKNYQTYLTICFNTLFDAYHNQEGDIVFSGGATDCHPPYKRSEGGEMKHWFEKQIIPAEKNLGRRLKWKLKVEKKSLTTIENVLFFKPFVKDIKNILVFVDKTRTGRMKKFVKAVLGKNVKVIPVDFDASGNRYNVDFIKWREPEDLKVGLAALEDPEIMKLRRDFAKKKLAVIRKHGYEKGNKKLPDIIKQLYNEYQRKHKEKTTG